MAVSHSSDAPMVADASAVLYKNRGEKATVSYTPASRSILGTITRASSGT